MIAAAQGRPRGTDLTDLDALTYTIRVDRLGERLRDWHTVGGGYPKHQTVMTADGSAAAPPSSSRTTSSPTPPSPSPSPAPSTPGPGGHRARPSCLPPYLGRRACPPALPVLIGTSTDPITDLDRLPSTASSHARTSPPSTSFHRRTPPADEPHRPPTRHISDAPCLTAATPPGPSGKPDVPSPPPSAPATAPRTSRPSPRPAPSPDQPDRPAPALAGVLHRSPS